MKTASVVLCKDVPGLGSRGEVKTVSVGYARNYLVPQALAMEATPSALKTLEGDRKRYEKEQAVALEAARALAKKLGHVSLTLRRQSGEEGKLFGSVTAGDVAEALAKEGLKLDKRTIHMDEPLKVLGAYTVTIRLHPDVEGKVKVLVAKE